MPFVYGCFEIGVLSCCCYCCCCVFADKIIFVTYHTFDVHSGGAVNGVVFWNWSVILLLRFLTTLYYHVCMIFSRYHTVELKKVHLYRFTLLVNNDAGRPVLLAASIPLLALLCCF